MKERNPEDAHKITHGPIDSYSLTNTYELALDAVEVQIIVPAWYIQYGNITGHLRNTELRETKRIQCQDFVKGPEIYQVEIKCSLTKEQAIQGIEKRRNLGPGWTFVDDPEKFLKEFMHIQEQEFSFPLDEEKENLLQESYGKGTFGLISLVYKSPEGTEYTIPRHRWEDLGHPKKLRIARTTEISAIR